MNTETAKSGTMNTAMGTYYLGIDVGGTTVKLGLFRTDEAPQSAQKAIPRPVLIDRCVISTRTEDGGIHVVPDTADAIQKLAETNGISPADIDGAGIGVPGPVLPFTEDGYPVNGCVNLGRSGIYYIDRELRELTGIDRICVLNDANAAALGELYFGGSALAEGSDAPASSAVMVTLGTGVGGGIIYDGRIISGAFGAGGEFGHMPVTPCHPLLQEVSFANPDLQPSADLEYYVSATGIVRMAEAALRASNGPSVLRATDGFDSSDYAPALDARTVIDAAKKGDQVALDVLDFFFDTLGRGLAAIASVVDPRLFIIGGGVSAAGDYLLDGLRTSYRKYAFHPSRDADFRLAVLGNNAGLLGPLVPLLTADPE